MSQNLIPLLVVSVSCSTPVLEYNLYSTHIRPSNPAQLEPRITRKRKQTRQITEVECVGKPTRWGNTIANKSSHILPTCRSSIRLTVSLLASWPGFPLHLLRHVSIPYHIEYRREY